MEEEEQVEGEQVEQEQDEEEEEVEEEEKVKEKERRISMDKEGEAMGRMNTRNMHARCCKHYARLMAPRRCEKIDARIMHATCCSRDLK